MYPCPDDVDEVAFGYGLSQKNLVKIVLLNALATILRKFSIARSPKDGNIKYLRSTIKAITAK